MGMSWANTVMKKTAVTPTILQVSEEEEEEPDIIFFYRDWLCLVVKKILFTFKSSLYLYQAIYLYPIKSELSASIQKSDHLPEP